MRHFWPPPERRTEGKADGLYHSGSNPAGWKPAGRSRILRRLPAMPSVRSGGGGLCRQRPAGLKDERVLRNRQSGLVLCAKAAVLELGVAAWVRAHAAALERGRLWGEEATVSGLGRVSSLAEPWGLLRITSCEIEKPGGLITPGCGGTRAGRPGRPTERKKTQTGTFAFFSTYRPPAMAGGCPLPL
jgi:hypothetical protein